MIVDMERCLTGLSNVYMYKVDILLGAQLDPQHA